jgi:cyclin H
VLCFSDTNLFQSLPQADPSWTSTATFEDGMKHIRASRLTDAELIYTPSQIALACLSIVSETAAAEWMRAKGAEIVPIIESIKSLIQSEGSIPDNSTVREIDRRLKLCKNPATVPGTRAYLAKQAEEQRVADEKRIKKAAASQDAMDAEDPFESTPAGAPVDDDDDDD